MEKQCFIANCPNKTSSAKIFVRVPMKEQTRKLWWAASGNTSKLYLSAKYVCCEDHFNIPDDFQNWIFAKTTGAQLKLKPGVVPKVNLLPSSTNTELNMVEIEFVEVKSQTPLDVQLLKETFDQECQVNFNCDSLESLDNSHTFICNRFVNKAEICDAQTQTEIL